MSSRRMGVGAARAQPDAPDLVDGDDVGRARRSLVDHTPDADRRAALLRQQPLKLPAGLLHFLLLPAPAQAVSLFAHALVLDAVEGGERLGDKVPLPRALVAVLAMRGHAGALALAITCGQLTAGAAERSCQGDDPGRLAGGGSGQAGGSEVAARASSRAPSVCHEDRAAHPPRPTPPAQASTPLAPKRCRNCKLFYMSSRSIQGHLTSQGPTNLFMTRS